MNSFFQSKENDNKNDFWFRQIVKFLRQQLNLNL